MTPDEYLKHRVEDQIRWYADKGAWNQRWYRRLRAIEIVLAASIPILVTYADEAAGAKLLVGAVGVVIAAIAGLFSLYRFQENWVEYRNAAETLKREKYLYLTGSPPYEGADPFTAFVARCEAAMGAENAKWTTLLSASAQGAQPPGGGAAGPPSPPQP